MKRQDKKARNYDKQAFHLLSGTAAKSDPNSKFQLAESMA